MSDIGRTIARGLTGWLLAELLRRGYTAQLTSRNYGMLYVALEPLRGREISRCTRLRLELEPHPQLPDQIILRMLGMSARDSDDDSWNNLYYTTSYQLCDPQLHHNLLQQVVTRGLSAWTEA